MHALRDISLTLTPGEFVGITGPSGSGKSTLLNILGLSDAPSSGTLRFPDGLARLDDEAWLVTARRRFIGYVFQSFNLLGALTALENVALSLVLNGVPWRQAGQRAGNLLERVGLGGRLNHLPAALSGGEMQRVAVCRAVIHEPVLILADEPTGNLDSVTGDAVLELLREYAGPGRVIVMATHSDRALGWCSRQIRLLDGRISP